MKKALVLTLFALSLTACGGLSPSQSSSAKEKTKLTDMNGRVVEVELGSYKKIVYIGAGALRLYSYIGDVSLLAGVEDIDNMAVSGRPAMFDGVARPYFIAYENEFKGLPSVGKGGPMAQAAEAEAILSCKPDLIISEYEDVEQADKLQEKVGVPVLTLKYGYGGVFDEAAKGSLEMLGKVLGKDEKAAKLTSFIQNSKEDIEKRTANVTSDELVYICGLGNWGTTNHLMSAKDYMPFNLAHINNIGDELLTKKGISSVEKEKLVARYADIDKMIIDAAAIKNIKPLLQEDPNLFEGCKAVEDGEVYLEMAYNAYYTNLEIALANTYFAGKAVHPEAFKDIDIKAKLGEITTAFLGKDLSKEIYE
ncbi:MAG: ABC transporter substrate-binding protein, partial [Bacilli bacterium]|nr:ABC transporter substrate-binding protein [Bacilli bacterium]